MVIIGHFPQAPAVRAIIKTDKAQIVRFPNLRTRAEIAALDEDCAAIAINRAFDRLDQAIEAAECGSER